MLIQDMHYDFKQKINKIDSQKYRNLRIPEIDWKINEAQDIFIKTIASPRYRNGLGIEMNQRNIDDIRTIVVEKNERTPVPFDAKSVVASLPDNYWFLLSSKALGTKGSCSNTDLLTHLKQHDDEHEDSAFDSSSFEWREVNYRFYKGGIRYFTDGSFTIDKVYLDYIEKPPYIHYAQGYMNGNYKLPSGEVLSGVQHCILPEGSHREIVDLAVLIATGDLQIPDYQIKMAKVKMND